MNRGSLYEDAATDNSKIKKCPQCRRCIFRAEDTPQTKGYRKAVCDMFLFELNDFKPIGIINGTEECEWYEAEE